MTLPGVSLAGSCPAVSQLVDWISTQPGVAGLQITSAKRNEGSGSLHDSGQAVDISGSNAAMCALTNIMNQQTGSLAELIHNDPNCDGSVKNGAAVPASFWGGATWSQHTNHVHIGVPNCNNWGPGAGTGTSTTGGPGGIIGSLVPFVGLVDLLVQVFNKLGDPKWWLRVGEIFLGAIMLVAGIQLITHETTNKAISSVMGEQKKSNKRKQSNADQEEYDRYQSHKEELSPSRAPGETMREKAQ